MTEEYLSGLENKEMDEFAYGKKDEKTAIIRFDSIPNGSIEENRKIENANQLLYRLAHSDLKNFKFIRDEEKEKNNVVTYEHDYDKGNVRKVRVTFNPFALEHIIEQMVMQRLKAMKIIR